MTRDFLMATIAALGLTACGPDLETDTKPRAKAGAAPTQPVEAGRPAGSDPAVAQAGEPKEEGRQENGEKPPR